MSSIKLGQIELQYLKTFTSKGRKLTHLQLIQTSLRFSIKGHALTGRTAGVENNLMGIIAPFIKYQKNKTRQKKLASPRHNTTKIPFV